MATVDSKSPAVTTRDQNPPIGDGGTITGNLDLGTVSAWSFLSSFAFPAPDHFEFTYKPLGPKLDVGAGRVARFDNATQTQTILRVGPVTDLALSTSALNYVFFTGADTIEVRDADNPPDGDSLLLGTVQAVDGTVETSPPVARGRSPVSQFIGEGDSDTATSTSGTSVESRTVIDAEDVAAGGERFHREYCTSGQVVRLTTAGVMDDSLSSTSGVTAEVVGATSGTTYHSTSEKRVEGDPINRIFGEADLKFRVKNATSSTVNTVSGRWEYDVLGGAASPTTQTITIIDDFEDGNVTTTVDPDWSDWTVGGGTWQTESSDPIAGTYSGSHTVTGTNWSVYTTRSSAAAFSTVESKVRVGSDTGASGDRCFWRLFGPNGTAFFLRFNDNSGSITLLGDNSSATLGSWNPGDEYLCVNEPDFSSDESKTTVENLTTNTVLGSGTVNFYSSLSGYSGTVYVNDTSSGATRTWIIDDIGYTM